MNKIFLVGKFNTIFQDINNNLGQFFHVQMCVDNNEMMKGMLKLKQPELIIISLIGMSKEDKEILNEVKNNYSHIPVICIGTESEQEIFSEYFVLEQFSVLTRPITHDKIVKKICQLLGVEIQKDYEKENDIVIRKAEKKKTILLVDDNPMQLRTMNAMLNQMYDVQVATSGMKALTLIGKKLPDIIFLDYEMPMCDGKMTLEMIREVDEAKDIPVVFLTGVSDKEHIEAVLRLKPEGYLLKPASADRIFEILDRILEQ